MDLPLDNIKEKEIINLSEEATDTAYGSYPKKRGLKQRVESGFVLLDKPSRTRSKTAASIAKQILSPLGVKKVGYSGTLDPNVTGLLPIALNAANKALSLLLVGGKEYIALMHLHKSISVEVLNKTFKEFTGKIMQLPPVRSHVKRQYREREIYYSEILEIDNNDVLFKVGVESGTYIRKLIHDIGEKLGIGAHMVELRRTKVSTLTEKDHLVTLQDLDDAMYYYEHDSDERFIDYCIQNIEDAIDFLPKVFVSDSAVDTICNGSPLAIPGIVKMNHFKSGEKIFISTLKGELIALGKSIIASEEIKANGKGIVVKTDSVIMKTGTYPKYVKI
jgi:H/ACA ribonucleoprotein complex subunit 4